MSTAALGAFQGVLVASGRSKGAQRCFVGLARRWLEAGGVPGHLDTVVLSEFLRGYRDQVSVGTVNNFITALRSFYRAMALCGHCAPGTADQLPRMRKVHKRLVRYLTIDQVADVLAAPDIDTPLGFRDAVVLRILFETGLRCSELVNLGLGDVLADGMVFVSRGKGGRDRYVPITPDLHAFIEHWIDRRRAFRPGKRAALIVGAHGKPIGARTVWHIVSTHTRAALGRACGVAQLVSSGRPWQGHYPHLLRASIATAWHQRGMPITAIAELLGHSSIVTTAHYVAVDIEQLRQAIACHPRSTRPVV